MIQSKKDLRFYIAEDRKRNLRANPNMGKLDYFFKRLYGNENIMACEYLKCLRKLEYHLNCGHGVLGKICQQYYRWKHRRLTLKYNVYVRPNEVGYGLTLSHFRVGGVL